MARLFNLLLQDVRDRFTGNKSRANARLGLVRPPEGTGKLIWLVADDTFDSVLMASALLAAISEKRLDVRLVLTYQAEYQDVIIEHMSGLKKIGFGFGCGDNKFAAQKMLKRLSPFAIIFVGSEPQKTLMHALEKKPSIHKIAFQFRPKQQAESAFYEACYPESISKNTINTQTCDYTSGPFNVLTRLVQSQVDKQLGSMLCGEAVNGLFHVHNIDEKNIGDMLSLWSKSDISKQSLLALTFTNVNFNEISSLKNQIIKFGYTPVLLSQWKQNPVSVNEIIIADDEKWYAALCTSSVSTHLFKTSAFYFWQAVSSGAVVTLDEVNNAIADSFEDVLYRANTFVDVISYWSELTNKPLLQRNTSDVIRKIFWSERRESEKQVNELLQRVYDW